MSSFDEATLLAVLGEYRGLAYDLAGLRGLAERVTRFYREQGYPFALAYLPPQTMADGRLVIGVVEGRYGEVRVVGDEALAQRAQDFLTGLQPGAVIEGAPLERAVQVLGDQSGISISPTMTPGTAVGTGDLEIRIAEGKRIAGGIGLDNHGNRYTGAWRTSATVGFNRLLTFGDQLTFGALLTEEELWYGQLGYALPLGNSGLRGRADHVWTHYELGGDFAALGADGSARVTTLGVEYPLLRSQRSNLMIQAGYRHKSLKDRPSESVPENGKSSDSLPLALRFDRRDDLAGGGLTWGTLEWTPGRLDLNAALQAADVLTAGTDGDFARLNLEVARIQKLYGAFSLFGRFNGQWSNGNLDSSEGFGLGGPNGVRAYPVGEGYGDRGWLGQIELRWALGAFSPYGFYDAGKITVNADSWEAGENHRSLAGGGVGLRLNNGGWNLDAAVAWSTSGGQPQSDTRDDHPRFWMNVGYRF
jgi:hemolysin activation/secretion protein